MVTSMTTLTITTTLLLLALSIHPGKHSTPTTALRHDCSNTFPKIWLWLDSCILPHLTKWAVPYRPQVLGRQTSKQLMMLNIYQNNLLNAPR